MAYYSTTDFNNDNYSYDSSVSDTSETRKQKKILEDMKRLDPNYFILYRKSNLSKKTRRKKIELYQSSYRQNALIRNAVTGFYEKYKVGKNESNLLFKVILATGETGPNPPHLYFDSPEQYEYHFNMVVSDIVKLNWTNKYNSEVEKHINQSKQSENMNGTIVK